MGGVLGIVLIMGAIFLFIAGMIAVIRWADSPRRVRHIPPSPPKADASNKELAAYYRSAAAYYQKVGKPEEVRFYENLAIGYDDMKGEIP